MLDAKGDKPPQGTGIAEEFAAPPRGVAVLASHSVDEDSFDKKELDHGVFTYALLEGLGGKTANKSGEITLESLASFTAERVDDRIRMSFPNRKQTPVLATNQVQRVILVK